MVSLPTVAAVVVTVYVALMAAAMLYLTYASAKIDYVDRGDEGVS